jgi:hypothetical protein
MKRTFALLCLLALSSLASAQIIGMPIADGAAAPPMGETRASAGAVLGDDFNLYGARLSFAPIHRLALFVDFGAIDPDGGDMGFAFQGGAKFTLPLNPENLADVALRATFGNAGFDFHGGDVDMTGFTGGAEVSRTLGAFTPYAFLGLSFLDYEAQAGSYKESKDETDLAFALGSLLRFGQNFSLYVELAHVDDFLTAFGGRWDF